MLGLINGLLYIKSRWTGNTILTYIHFSYSLLSILSSAARKKQSARRLGVVIFVLRKTAHLVPGVVGLGALGMLLLALQQLGHQERVHLLASAHHGHHCQRVATKSCRNRDKDEMKPHLIIPPLFIRCINIIGFIPPPKPPYLLPIMLAISIRLSSSSSALENKLDSHK